MKKRIPYGIGNYAELVEKIYIFVDQLTLSRWFTWNLERSYPQGQSDLEFVGKFHERYAGLPWVIEFKYYSNSKFKKLNTTIADFVCQPEDTQQIAGYVEGLRQEYPEARIERFVIYCFGNQGFRVFVV